MSNSKKSVSKVSDCTFTQLIEREKTNIFDKSDNSSSDELCFEDEVDLKNRSPQPRPDLLAFLHDHNNVCVLIIQILVILEYFNCFVNFRSVNR